MRRGPVGAGGCVGDPVRLPGGRGCGAGRPARGHPRRAPHRYTGPVTHVLVRNLRNRTYKGTIAAKFPDGWKMNRAEQQVTIPPRQTARVAFAIERGTNVESNLYRVQVRAAGAGAFIPTTLKTKHHFRRFLTSITQWQIARKI